MWIRDSCNFKKIVILSERYSDALDEMTPEQAQELNRVLKELIVINSYKVHAYKRAYKNYRNFLCREYINSLLDGNITDEEEISLPII